MALIQQSEENGSSISPDGEFAKAIRSLIRVTRPRRIIETGTFHADGTTAVIAQACADFFCGEDFRTIEACPKNVVIAGENISAKKMHVRLHHGLSLPTRLLPSKEEIAENLKVLEKWPADLLADFGAGDRARAYYEETRHPGVESDILGKILKKWGGRCDVFVLDSAGHLGFQEFTYCRQNVEQSCIFILDDTNHVKHAMTADIIRKLPQRFRIIDQGDERAGWVIAHYNPE